MTIADKTVLVTGANRGIGQALVEEALRRGAKRVYAGTRQPLAHIDGRVMPLTLDVTNAEQIQAAVKKVGSLDVLINNAGIALHDDLSNLDAIGQHFAVIHRLPLDFFAILRFATRFAGFFRPALFLVVADFFFFFLPAPVLLRPGAEVLPTARAAGAASMAAGVGATGGGAEASVMMIPLVGPTWPMAPVTTMAKPL